MRAHVGGALLRGPYVAPPPTPLAPSCVTCQVRRKLVGNSPPNYSDYTCYTGISDFTPPDIDIVGYRVFLGNGQYFVSSDVGGGKMQVRAARGWGAASATRRLAERASCLAALLKRCMAGRLIPPRLAHCTTGYHALSLVTTHARAVVWLSPRARWRHRPARAAQGEAAADLWPLV